MNFKNIEFSFSFIFKTEELTILISSKNLVSV